VSSFIPRATRRVILLAVAGGLGACSSGSPSAGPPTAPAAKVIGTQGGTLQATDGHAAVTIPAGALAASVNVTVAAAPSAPTGAVGTAWSFGPDGTTFAAPVKLELDIDASAMPAGVDPSALTVARLENGQWNPLVASFVDPGTGKAVALTQHFSVYAVVYKRCLHDAECAAPAQCWNQQTCVVPCRDATDCPAPMACLGGRCALKQCNGDADCAAPTHCAGVSAGVSFCMDPCSDATMCGGDQSCAAPPQGGSSVCQFNSCGTCGDGRVCSGDICWPANAGCKCGTPGCPCGGTVTSTGGTSGVAGASGLGGHPNTGGTGGDVTGTGGTGGGTVTGSGGGHVDIGGTGGGAITGAGGSPADDGWPQDIASCADPTTPNPLVQNPGVEGGNIESLVVRHLSSADTVLAASNGGGLWRSVDSGATWSRVGTGVLEAQVTTLADDGTTFYAGTGNQYTPGAVYASSDGATWSKVGLIGQAVYDVVAYKGAVWAGTDQGVFVSHDQGATFASRGTGLPAGNWVLSIDVDDDYVWAGTNNSGAFRAPAAAGDFAPLSTGLPTGAYVRALKAVKSGGATTSVLAGVDNGGPTGQGEVYEQTDGATWVPASQGFWDDPSAYKRVDEFFQLGGTVYAGCDWGGGLMARPATPGSTWSDLSGSIENRNIFAVGASSDGARLLVGTFGEGVLTSPTDGSAWVRTNGGLLAQKVYALAAGKAGTTDALFAGTEGDSVYRSLDGGKSWSRSSNGMPAGYVWALDGVDQNVYAGTYGFGVYLSTDGGSTWQQTNGTGDTALGNLIVVALTHDANGVLYAGTRGGGVWKAIGTDQWAPINVGLTQLSVNTLLAAPDGSLFAGTSGGAVWAFANNQWTQLGSGLPSTAQVSSLASTPAGALCAALGSLVCMPSPSPTGTWHNAGGDRAAGTSLAVADGLVYMGGWGDVLERLDVSAQPCWRPEIHLDSQVYHLLTTPTSVIIATNDGLLVQSR
jgi:hypothetical protein